MKKLMVLATMLLLMLTNGFAQRVDTLYYDSKGKGVPNKDFADIIMMVYYGEEESMNRFRAFYTSGETYGQGGFASIDKHDVNMSQLKNFELFYKSGKLMKSYNIDGIIEVKKEFYENGNYLRYDSLVNNKAEGVQYYEGSSDGKIIKTIEMKEGEPVNPYYTIWNNGVPCNYYIEDNSVCNEDVTEFSVKEYIDENLRTYYYAVNGLYVQMTSFSKTGDDKTKPSMFYLRVFNRRNSSVEFTKANISARSTDGKNKKKPNFKFDNKISSVLETMSIDAGWNWSKIFFDRPELWLKDKIIESDEYISGYFILGNPKNWDFIDVELDNKIYSFPISSKYCNSSMDYFNIAR